MSTETRAAAENSEPTATPNYDARIAEIVGAPAPAENAETKAPEDPKKPEDAATEPSKQPEGQGTETKAPEGEADKQEGESGKSEETQPAALSEDAAAPMRRLNKRIVQKAIQNANLSGHELEEEQVMAVLATKSYEERKTILKELLAENATLRGKERADVGVEDIDAIVEEEAQQKADEIIANREIAEAEKAEERRKGEWHTSLSEIIKNNPALDQKSSEYNPVLADALELMLSDDGEKPRYSIDPKSAWEKVQKAARIAQENAEQQVETNRSKALAGALSGTGSKLPKGGVDWDEVARLAQDDPEEYKRRIRTGEIPA